MSREAITVGCLVRHLGTGKTRRVAAMRNGVVHFSQVIKKQRDGREATFYWADADKCRRIG